MVVLGRCCCCCCNPAGEMIHSWTDQLPIQNNYSLHSVVFPALYVCSLFLLSLSSVSISRLDAVVLPSPPVTGKWYCAHLEVLVCLFVLSRGLV